MNGPALQRYLLDLFNRFDVELEPDEDDWLVTDGDFPAIRATWHADIGRLDVDIVLDEERRIEESFAGTTADDALKAFEDQALYMLLAACWYVTDERKLRIEAWDIGIRTWDVFIGPPSLRGTDAVPAAAFEAMATAIRTAGLEPALHWLSFYFARDAEGVRCQVTLDNEPWAAGTTALAAVAWPEGQYVVRWLTTLDVRDY